MDTMAIKTDENFMQMALREAQRAYKKGEVPIGAVVVYEGKIIGQAHNQPILRQDPTAHAEILALREAAQRINNYRLTGCTLFVTIEPCLMCTGAMQNARIERLVFGAIDPKGGGVCSQCKLREFARLDYPPHVTQGVLKEECGEIIQRFFKARRPGKQDSHAGRAKGSVKEGEVPKWS